MAPGPQFAKPYRRVIRTRTVTSTVWVNFTDVVFSERCQGQEIMWMIPLCEVQSRQHSLWWEQEEGISGGAVSQ